MKKFCRLFIVLFVINLQAQPPSKFSTRFGGDGNDIGFDVKETFNRQYIVAGSTGSFGYGLIDAFLLLVDSMGAPIWQKSYGGVLTDVAKSIIVNSADSGFIFTGYTNSIGNGGYDVFVVRTDKNGVVIWQKSFGGLDWDFGSDIDWTLDGNIIVCGNSYSSKYGKTDGVALKINPSNGSLIWQKVFGGNEDDEFKAITSTNDGGYALAGVTKSYNDINGNAWVFKLDVNGDSLYSKSMGGAYTDFFNAVIQLQSGDIYFSGGNRSANSNTNCQTWNYCMSNTTYTMVLDYVDPGTTDEYYFGVAQGLNGAIASCGVTNNLSTKLNGVVDMLKSDFTYLNFFSNGSAEDDEFFAIDKTSDKGFVMIGRTTGYGAKLDDMFLLKIDSIGGVSSFVIGIKDISPQNDGILVYPNPTNGILYLDGNSNSKTIIELNDGNGRLVYSNRNVSSKIMVDLSLFNDGVYTLRLKNDQKEMMKTAKIILVK